ncbi:MAG: 2-hydroxy-6-oxohepta-2,4-dienoate hydrolase [uncultured Sulfurovum sp.]|uniref:2-hydroxy-6-oxohepta-2,4-dienoate hydrolase n=1 Tax=uncultured Sulfurovum sp. TaxID=269237 RepID=A0A6S6S694_9BACT|nr:MAG: 2-hydroxy-6-oxohepta-2,4-dienoate hydrolase [uncultured Sulfurovum sp.]
MAVKEISYKSQTFKLSYEIVNPSQEEAVLVLHGWGSNKEIMKQAFGKELREYKHIYLDMPGFGTSTNEMILTTTDYAQIVKLFLEALKVKVLLAMGHSFGGKVATLLDTKYLVLLSSAGVITEKPWSIKVKIATFKLLKPLGFKKIRELFVAPDAQGMSHEMYETFKNVVDEDFEREFSKSKSSALCFWGIDDTATPLYTGKKIAELLKNSKFYPLEGDHFFFLKHANVIAHEIEKNLKKS